MSHRPTPPLLSGLLVALLSLTLAACTGTDEKPSPTGSVPAPTTVTAAPPSSQPAGAFKQLSDVSCKQSSSGWSFSATLRNGDQVRTTFTVSVAIAKTSGGTVVGSTEMTKTLDPGASTTVTAKDFYKGKDDGVQCVPSATKAPA